MAIVIDRVNPAVGLGSGRTLIEIEGSGFTPPTVPPFSGAPRPAPDPTMRVTIGGRRASDVRVYSAAYLTCLTPEGDPFTVSIAATVLASTNVFTAAGHTFKNGDLLRFGGSTLPAPLKLPTDRDALPIYAVNVVPGVSFQASYTVGGAAIDILADGSVTVASDGKAHVVVSNLSAGVVTESTTAQNAFSFRRPDLTKEEGALTSVFRELVLMLQRSVLENVVFTTNRDYDDTTGDTLNIAAITEFPTLIFTEVDIPEDTIRPSLEPEQIQIGDRFIQQEPPIICDATMVLVGVSDDPNEFFNMLQATKKCFQKPKLRVPRNRGGDLDDVIEYVMRTVFGSVQVTVNNAPNAHSFAAQITIEGVRLEDIPGAPTDAVDGAPAGYPHAMTRIFGYTAERVDAGAGKKP